MTLKQFLKSTSNFIFKLAGLASSPVIISSLTNSTDFFQVNAYITLLPSYSIRKRLLIIEGKQREKQDSWHFPPKATFKAVESWMCCTIYPYVDEHMHSVPVHLHIAYFCPPSSRYSAYITIWVTPSSALTRRAHAQNKRAEHSVGAGQASVAMAHTRRGIFSLGRSNPWMHDRYFLFRGQVPTLDSRTYFHSRKWWRSITTFRIN